MGVALLCFCAQNHKYGFAADLVFQYLIPSLPQYTLLGRSSSPSTYSASLAHTRHDQTLSPNQPELKLEPLTQKPWIVIIYKSLCYQVLAGFLYRSFASLFWINGHSADLFLSLHLPDRSNLMRLRGEIPQGTMKTLSFAKALWCCLMKLATGRI